MLSFGGIALQAGRAHRIAEVRYVLQYKDGREYRGKSSAAKHSVSMHAYYGFIRIKLQCASSDNF